MDELLFEEFGIRSYRSLLQHQTEDGDDRMSRHLIGCHLNMTDQSQSEGCCSVDVTEIFPSPVDIYEVRKAWFGDKSSENIANDDDVGQLGVSDHGRGVHGQGHRSRRTGPAEGNAKRTPSNISRSLRTNSRECLQGRGLSGTEKVIGPRRTVVDVTRATWGESTKPISVGSLSTSLSSSSSSTSSPASAAKDGRSTSKVTDIPTVQLEQAVYRVRTFATDDGNVVINLGDSFKVFNRLLLLTNADNSGNGCSEQPLVDQAPPSLPRSSTVVEVTAFSEDSKSTVVPARNPKTPNSRTALKSAADRSNRHRFCSSSEFRLSDRSGCIDAETGDANEERKELLKHDSDRNSSEEEEDEDGYELLRRVAFPAIPPSPEDAGQKRSSTGAAIALRSLGGEGHDCGGVGSINLRLDEGASLPREGEEEEEDDHWAGDGLLRVRLIGSQGVGKTTLMQQLMTSEYRPTELVTSSDMKTCCGCSSLDNIVVVQVDDVQSVVQFIDVSGEVADPCEIGSGGGGGGGGAPEVDVYLVVYSVTDRSSFKYAGALLRQINRRFPASRSFAPRQPVAILVANKQDLVRKRVVSESSGKRLALKRRCKFIEISAFLDHRVDDLLVGILKQLQLQQLRQCQAMEDGEEEEDDDEEEGDFRKRVDATGCLRNIRFLRFWRRLAWKHCSNHAYQPSSCDDLFV